MYREGGGNGDGKEGKDRNGLVSGALIERLGMSVNDWGWVVYWELGKGWGKEKEFFEKKFSIWL